MVKFALGFVLGVFCLQQQAALPSGWLILLCLFSAFVFTLIQYRFFAVAHLNRRIRTILTVTIAGMLGFSWAAWQAQHRLSDALTSAYEGENITLVGVVASLPRANDRGQRFTLDVEQVLSPQAVVPKHIALSFYPYRFNSQQRIAPKGMQFSVGQRWQLTVRLKRPHGSYNPHGFDYEAWAFSRSIRATGYIHLKVLPQLLNQFVWRPSYIVHKVRTLIGERIDGALYGSAYSGVIRALVIGDESQISQSQWQTYLQTGTNHLMSISGLHITMLAGFAYALMNGCWRRFPILVYRLPAQKAATIAGMVTAMLYAALAGFSVPTQRTLYMLMTVAIMLLLGRKVSFPVVLATALLVVAVLDPWAVLGAGFWLSFGAVAAIVYATSGRLANGHWLSVATKTQWAVTLALVPILVLMFGQFSLISPIANAFAIPLVSFAVVPPAILGSLFDIELVMRFAHMMLALGMVGLNWITELPIVVWQQQAPSVCLVILAIIGIAWHLVPAGLPFRHMALSCVFPMLLLKSNPLPHGAFTATVLDVGQGLSVVIRTQRHTLLYDAGAKYSEERDAGTNMILPFLRGEGIKQFDMAIASHDDLDHVGGYPSVLNHIPIYTLLSSLEQDARLLDADAYKSHPPQLHQTCIAGNKWTWDGVDFMILSPNAADLQGSYLKDNDKSCVLRISSEHGSILLTGDIEKHREYWLLDNAEVSLSSDVLVAPHHGSKTSSTQPFLEAVSPLAVVFSSGYRNRFGHPKADVVSRYENIDANIYRSDHDGAVHIRFDYDDDLKVSTWRRKHSRYWHDKH